MTDPALTLDETAWLLRLSEKSGRRQLTGLGISDPMLDSLIDKGLVILREGSFVQVTYRGMTEAQRVLEE